MLAGVSPMFRADPKPGWRNQQALTPVTAIQHLRIRKNMLPADNLAALAHPAVALTIGLFFFGGWLARRVDYFIPISAAYVAFSIGMFLQIAAVPVSDEVSSLLTGALYILAMLCFYCGVVRAGRGTPVWPVAMLIAVLFLVFRYVYTIEEFNSVKRIYALQSFMTLLFLLACWNIRWIVFRGSGAERLMFFAVLIFALSALPRTFYTVGTDLERYGYDASPYWIATQIMFNVFIVVFSLSLVLVNSTRKLSKMESRVGMDPLTKLSNRAGFNSKVESIRSRSDFYSLVFIDIDRFKHINDAHGHGVGDEVLARVSAVIAGNIRETDEASRYGGEEFLVFLPNTKADAAHEIAERLRKSIMQNNMDDLVEGLHCTASVGVAEFSPAVSVNAAYRYVDQLMYAAKAEGRNRVCFVRSQVSSVQAPPLESAPELKAGSV